jgi:methyl-accepting chemotaxis protein
MNWINNMRVGTKLIVGFLLVAAIAAAIGITGIIKIRQIDDADTKLYEKETMPLAELANMSVSFQRVRINLRDIIESKDDKEAAAYLETLAKLRQEISGRSVIFEKTILTEEGRRLFSEFKEARQVYGGYIDRVLELHKSGKEAEALALLHGDAKKSALHEQELMNKLMESKEAQAKLTSDTNTKEATSATLVMSALAVAGVMHLGISPKYGAHLRPGRIDCYPRQDCISR